MNTKPLGLGLITKVTIPDCANEHGIGCKTPCDVGRTCQRGWKSNTYDHYVTGEGAAICDERLCSCELDVHNGNDYNWETAKFPAWIGADGNENKNCGSLLPEQGKTLKDVFKLRCCLGMNQSPDSIIDPGTIVKQPFSRDHMCSPNWNFRESTGVCDDVVAPFCSVPKNFSRVECQLYCNMKDDKGNVRGQDPDSWCHEATKNFCMSEDPKTSSLNMVNSPQCMNMFFKNDGQLTHPEWLDEFMVDYCKNKQSSSGMYPPECACILSDTPGKLLFDPVCHSSEGNKFPIFPAYKTHQMEKDGEDEGQICDEVVNHCNSNRINFPDDFDKMCPSSMRDKNYFFGCSNGNCILKDGGEYTNDTSCEKKCPMHSLSSGFDPSICKNVHKSNALSQNQKKGNGGKYLLLIAIIVLIFFLIHRLRRKQ